MIEVEFLNQSDATTSAQVQKLRTALIDAGFPADALSIRKDNPAAQDAGTLLHIALTAFEALALAKTLYEIGVPERSGLRIKFSFGTLTIDPKEMNVESLEALLKLRDIPAGSKDTQQ